MKPRTIFTAQSIDRGDLDPIEVDGVMLTEDETSARESAMAILSEVSRNGLSVLEQDRLEVWADKSRYLIKVVPDELDKAGRKSPILASGLIIDTQTPDNIVARLQAFAASIERTIPTDCANAIENGVVKARKKEPSGVVRWIAVVGLTVVCLMLAALLLKS